MRVKAGENERNGLLASNSRSCRAGRRVDLVDGSRSASGATGRVVANRRHGLATGSTLDRAETLPMPEKIQTILDTRKASEKECAHADCPAYCKYAARRRAAKELLLKHVYDPFGPHTGFFSLREPYQFIPPPINPSYFEFHRSPQKRRVPTPMKFMFHDNDYSYLDDPESVTLDPFDFIKRVPITPQGKVRFDVGGEFRWLGKGEANSRLSGKENDLQPLSRTDLLEFSNHR